MKIKIFYLYFLLFLSFSFPLNIKVRILSPMKITQIKVKSLNGGILYVKKCGKYTLKSGEIVNFKIRQKKIFFKFKNKYFVTNYLKIKTTGGFLISSGCVKNRFYTGELIILIRDNLLIPLIFKDIEEFIPSIIMSESNSKNREFIKAFSVVIRSYIYSNLNRHVREGYNFCSSTHCFYYRGDFLNCEEIKKFVKETGGIVLKKGGKVFNAFYSTCCGGVRFKFSYGKLKFKRFLNSPFCKKSKYFSYFKILSKGKFFGELKKLFFMDVLDIRYKIIKGSPYVILKGKRDVKFIPVTHFRKKIFKIFKGKVFLSNFFRFEIYGDEVLVNGKGWGNNIGFCTEGAKEMSKMGYDFISILKFYFPECEISHL